jgi:hypothetical protein
VWEKEQKERGASCASLLRDVTEPNYCGDCVLELDPELELSLLLPVLELPELELFCGAVPWPTLLVSKEPP